MRKLALAGWFLAIVAVLPLSTANAAPNRFVFNNLFYNVYGGESTSQENFLASGDKARLTITDVYSPDPATNTVLLDGIISFIDPETGKRVTETFSGITGTGLTSEASQECPILYLEIAPIFLDVLGLTVELPNPLIVDVTAVQGPGKLLGNLLCGLLGLLDP